MNGKKHSPDKTLVALKNAPAKSKLEADKLDSLSVVAQADVKLTALEAVSTPETDEQLLAMPEEDYMSEGQLIFFKTRLTYLRKELLKNAEQTSEHLRETAVVPDPADRATIEEEYALELRTRDRERKLLKKIEQALSRIESHEYGWCEETGEPIGLQRLIARPTATLSLEAQQRRELRQKLLGG